MALNINSKQYGLSSLLKEGNKVSVMRCMHHLLTPIVLALSRFGRGGLSQYKCVQGDVSDYQLVLRPKWY